MVGFPDWQDWLRLCRMTQARANGFLPLSLCGDITAPIPFKANALSDKNTSQTSAPKRNQAAAADAAGPKPDAAPKEAPPAAQPAAARKPGPAGAEAKDRPPQKTGNKPKPNGNTGKGGNAGNNGNSGNNNKPKTNGKEKTPEIAPQVVIRPAASPVRMRRRHWGIAASFLCLVLLPV